MKLYQTICVALAAIVTVGGPPDRGLAQEALSTGTAITDEDSLGDTMLHVHGAVDPRKVAEKAAKAAEEAAKSAEKYRFDVFSFVDGRRSPPVEQKIRQAAVKVRDAQDAAAKSAATAELAKLLDEHFEADMRVRQQELAGIVARLEKLKAQLDRRRAKKQEIVDLQLKVALNEAEGLGFYSQPMSNFNTGGRPSIFVPTLRSFDHLSLPPDADATPHNHVNVTSPPAPAPQPLQPTVIPE